MSQDKYQFSKSVEPAAAKTSAANLPNMTVFSQPLKLLPSYQKHHNHEPIHQQPAQEKTHCIEVNDETLMTGT